MQKSIVFGSVKRLPRLNSRPQRSCPMANFSGSGASVSGAGQPSEELAAALTKAGVPNRLVVIPGAGHDLDFPIKTPRNLVFQILEFLDATWNDKIS